MVKLWGDFHAGYPSLRSRSCSRSWSASPSQRPVRSA